MKTLIAYTGIWAGRWEGDTETDHGNLLLELLQDESELNGVIFFREDLPSLANSGIRLNGTVFGNEITFRMTAGSEYSFHGIVDADRISGEIEYGAAWNATPVPSSEMHIIDSFDCPGRIPTYIAVESQKIWVFDDYGTHIWILQSSPKILVKYGDDGELLEAYKLPKSLNNFYGYRDLTNDGQNFWVLVSHFSPDLPNKEHLYKLGNE